MEMGLSYDAAWGVISQVTSIPYGESIEVSYDEETGMVDLGVFDSWVITVSIEEMASHSANWVMER